MGEEYSAGLVGPRQRLLTNTYLCALISLIVKSDEEKSLSVVFEAS